MDNKREHKRTPLKVQLRSIYDKTGCGREAQLVRLVGLIAQ